MKKVVITLNKVLINLFVPEINEKYEVFLPLNKKIINVIDLLEKSINEMYDVDVIKESQRFLYDVNTGYKFSLNATVSECKIIDGLKLILC